MNVRSTMVHKVHAYLVERREAGFALKISGQQLAEFASFTDATGYRGPLTMDVATRWATASRGGRRITSARRIEVLRCFASYCRSRDHISVVPPRMLFGPAHRRLTPHIYSLVELRTLMRSARTLNPPGGLRGETCATVIGLMASCGLRISEAVALRRQDVDLVRGCLAVRDSKFGKSRLVPMHSTTCRALKRYASRRDQFVAASLSDAFFVFEQGRFLTARHIHYAFRSVRLSLGRRPTGAHPRYRLHDLRHSFVCRRLERWYQQGVDIDRQMLALSTYVGHVKPDDTYWYVTATPRLLSLAARRVERSGFGGVV